MKLELLGVVFPITTGAKRLTSYLLSVGMKMLDEGDDVDGDIICERDLQLIAAIVNFKLQLRRRSHSEIVDSTDPTMSSSVHAVRRIVAHELVGIRSDLREQHGERHEAGEVKENGDNVRYAVVNGLEEIWYALSAGSPVTLEELRAMWGGGRRPEETSKASLEKMKRTKETIHQFHSENKKYYTDFWSKLADVDQDLKNRHDGSHMGVAHSQGVSLEEARDQLNLFTASEGEKLEHLDKAYDCSITALPTTGSSSLAALVPASIIAVSTSYAKNAKNGSPAKAKMHVFDGTFKTITDKLKPYWSTDFANITTEGLKVVEFLMDIASFVSLLPPENVVLPPLDDKLVQVFGCFCVWKPEMLQRYPELGRAVLRSYLFRTSDDFEREAIRYLLDSDELDDPRTDSDLPEPKPCRTAQSWYNLRLENWYGLPKDNSGFYHCAEQGLLPELKRLHHQDKTFPLDKKMCIHAAKGGHPNVLEWLLQNSCAYDIETSAVAAYEGHLNVLKWAVDNKRCRWDKTTCSAAAYGGHLEVLKWAVDKRCQLDETKCCSAAALGGHLDVLRWARDEKNMRWDEQVCSNAAFNGHMEVLQWARTRKCPWNTDVCSMAAFGGHLKILKWARENGCKWDEKTCSYAAKGGHLEILKWAREKECPWDKRTCTEADEQGFQDIVDWAKANGCPGNKSIRTRHVGAQR